MEAAQYVGVVGDTTSGPAPTSTVAEVAHYWSRPEGGLVPDWLIENFYAIAPLPGVIWGMDNFQFPVPGLYLVTASLITAVTVELDADQDVELLSYLNYGPDWGGVAG
jgi:hypothetical protein